MSTDLDKQYAEEVLALRSTLFGDFVSKYGHEVSPVMSSRQMSAKTRAKWGKIIPLRYHESADADTLVLFTDGSYDYQTGRGGWAVIEVVQDGSGGLVHAASGKVSVTDRPQGCFYAARGLSPTECELRALSEAFKVAVARCPEWTTLVVFCDNFGCGFDLARIKKGDDIEYIHKSGHYHLHDINDSCEQLKRFGIKVRLEFVKGHKKVAGNEAANFVARARSGVEQTLDKLKPWPVEGLPDDLFQAPL